MSDLSGRHVLVLEDEFFLAQEIEGALKNVGAIVLGPFAFARDAQKALEAQVDLAVLNVRVQDGLTYPIAALLRSRAIPFVFATGQERHMEPPEWQSAPWLSKPCSPNDIIRELTSLVETATAVTEPNPPDRRHQAHAAEIR